MLMLSICYVKEHVSFLLSLLFPVHRNPGEDDKMLVCDMCDKGYHTFCLQPAIDDIPTNGWRCQNCRVCIQCGTRMSGQWHHTSLLCESCVQHQDPALTCPLCACILDPQHQKDLLSCHSCKRWLHLECERQSSGQADIQPSQDYVCSSCRPTGPPPQQAPLQAEEEAEEMDTGGLELSPQAAIQMHTESEPVVPTHTDLEPGAKQLRSPSPMHNDPETQLQLVPMPTNAEPEPIQATYSVCENALEDRQPQQATSDQKPGVSVEAIAVEGVEQEAEVSVNKDRSQLRTEMQPAAETLITSTESPESPRLNKQKPEQPIHLPTQTLAEPEQPQDITTGMTKSANTEPSSEKSAVKPRPSTEDIKALTPPTTTTTKEPSTASVTIKEEPMEASASEPSEVEQVEGPSGLETAAKEAWKEKQMSGILTDGVSTVACALEEMDTTPETESKPNLSHFSSLVNDQPYKTSMERLAEMAASPTHSSSRNRGPSPRQPPQPHHPHPNLWENGSSFASTTLIPLTPKIGMGKPAISKRKFSPGRPRVKQVRHWWCWVGGGCCGSHLKSMPP
uniref:PHD-type domain-containing protein n=1 Tax=Hucho hucho TaxID=62062 RepID=A0A4W5P548_9TELE